MKKTILMLAVLLALVLSSCNYYSRQFGGDITVRLEPGEKLLVVTWKNADLWYLVEPMEDDYVPKTKIFKENSNAGLLNGTVTFIESRN